MACELDRNHFPFFSRALFGSASSTELKEMNLEVFPVAGTGFTCFPLFVPTVALSERGVATYCTKEKIEADTSSITCPCPTRGRVSASKAFLILQRRGC